MSTTEFVQRYLTGKVFQGEKQQPVIPHRFCPTDKWGGAGTSRVVANARSQAEGLSWVGMYRQRVTLSLTRASCQLGEYTPTPKPTDATEHSRPRQQHRFSSCHSQVGVTAAEFTLDTRKHAQPNTLSLWWYQGSSPAKPVPQSP